MAAWLMPQECWATFVCTNVLLRKEMVYQFVPNINIKGSTVTHLTVVL